MFKKKLNKKGQENHFIVFTAVFLTLMGILGSIFVDQLAEQEKYKNTLLTKLDEINDFVIWIPFIGAIVTLATSAVALVYVHPYLGMVITAIFFIPLGYIILRLARGGG